ncbi:Hypothetical protein GbCGDNIH3_0523 [Granulibacter bethesdensis]|uniref:PE cleavage protein A C-terminal domain-containing protein n=2 Tax=Granulibacter bethesdensis TaxID=364410 RepID=A0AAN0VF40_9PROT|nr:hypothetical protein [Granulibacter bethesdensis]AHJ62297.1 Hypothetical protein GbCGDNIH3_0523 [Granulibacter bethesdensis]AHJ64928.1 Hypothetical protein GbCGDNIH4_0523 [Granulibacter bethesdensis CGDNIH4]
MITNKLYRSFVLAGLFLATTPLAYTQFAHAQSWQASSSVKVSRSVSVTKSSSPMPKSVGIPLFPIRAGNVPVMVHISIGGGPTTSVSVDTGSAGLYVMQKDAGPDLVALPTRVRQAYTDGTRFDGYWAKTTIAFPDSQGPVTTRQPIVVGVITRVYCAATQPNCPGSINKPGIMGISMNTSTSLVSPLAQLPTPLSNGYIIDVRDRKTPTLTVGLTQENTAKFSFATLKPAKAGPAGAPSWTGTSLTGCYTVNGEAASCTPILFDTGASYGVFNIGNANPKLSRTGCLSQGQKFEIDFKDVFHLALMTTANTVFCVSKTATFSNIGSAPFRYMAVAYDAQNGRLGFMQ